MAVDKFEGTLAPIAEHIFGMKDIFLNLCKKYQTPFYAYDSEAIDKSATRFFQAFNSNIPKFKYYYSVKINSYEKISSRIISLGAGLEIASLRELSMALESGCKDLLYYSPGKTSTDLKEIINHRQKIILHIDSFSELNRIASLLSSLNSPLRAAVRINFTKCNNWSKYGIPLDDLLYFYECANKISGLDIQGIHFHTSRNLTAEPYVQSIKKLGMYISENFSDPLVKSLKYIDFGGGFERNAEEGRYSWSKISNSNKPCGFKSLESDSIETYANEIGNAIKKYLAPLIDVWYFAEPGRYICHSAMHIVLCVVDIKDDIVVVDGGVNLVGWQRFEHEYFPIINLTHPSYTEINVEIHGNLCTTWDFWGYKCYASHFEEGDILVVANQGALTWSLAQNFIQPIPLVHSMR